MNLHQLEREYFKRWTNGREQASSIVIKNNEDMTKVNEIRKQETKDYEIWLMLKGILREENKQYLREHDELHYGRKK